MTNRRGSAEDNAPASAGAAPQGDEMAKAKRATITVEVDLPPGVTIRGLRKAGALKIATKANDGLPIVLPVVQHQVAQAGN